MQYRPRTGKCIRVKRAKGALSVTYNEYRSGIYRPAQICVCVYFGRTNLEMLMYLFQILLPLYHNNNRRIGRSGFSAVEEELTKRYGGVTAYMRAPAEGQWITKGRKNRDQIIIIEVMARQLTLSWRRHYQKTLETRFRQESIVIRFYACQLV